MFGCHHLNPDLRLKPCLVVIMMTTKLLRTPNLPLSATTQLILELIWRLALYVCMYLVSKKPFVCSVQGAGVTEMKWIIESFLNTTYCVFDN